MTRAQEPQGKVIPCNSTKIASVMWFAALFMIGLGVFIIVSVDPSKPFFALTWLALLAAVPFVWIAVIQTRNRLRFGPTPLHMLPFPGEVGGQVAGRVALHSLYDPQHDFQATLKCTHVYKFGNRIMRDIQWQETLPAKSHPSAAGTALEVTFTPPADVPGSSSPVKRGAYEWTLEINADLPGPNFSRYWDIRVEKLK